MSLRSKLARLSGSAARPPPASPSEEPQGIAESGGAGDDANEPKERSGDVIGELRARMEAMLARAPKEVHRRRPERPRDLADLPFATETTELGPLHSRLRRFEVSHRAGNAPLDRAQVASSELLALLALDPSLARCDPRRALYLDTETTGLSGGTGTVAFLVGLGFWRERSFVLEQLFLRDLGEEAPILERVRQRIAEASMLVTFNGKSFDMPLLRTRYLMARQTPPIEPPHLDLLHVARRLHRSRGLDCRLVAIERELLGFERVDDTPSSQVSACYLHFLRTGDPEPVRGVIEHNVFDVVAMAALVGLYGQALDESELVPDDLAALARALRKSGDRDAALAIANVAVGRGRGAAALRARGEIAKAMGDKERALADFEALAATVDDASARLELAKLYEHFRKQPGRALDVALCGTSERGDAAERRVQRLARKVSKRRQEPLPGVAPGSVAGPRHVSSEPRKEGDS